MNSKGVAWLFKNKSQSYYWIELIEDIQSFEFSLMDNIRLENEIFNLRQFKDTCIQTKLSAICSSVSIASKDPSIKYLRFVLTSFLLLTQSILFSTQYDIQFLSCWHTIRCEQHCCCLLQSKNAKISKINWKTRDKLFSVFRTEEAKQLWMN